MNTTEKLTALRKQMRQSGVHAYFVPTTDPHQSEYAPACWERREWLSGFTGSAGEVVVTRSSAGLWTDGRYFLHAEAELAGSGIELFRMGQPGVPTVDEFIRSTLKKGQKFALDPRTVSMNRAQSFTQSAGAVGASVAGLENNLVDAVWKDRPAMPTAAALAQPIRFAGERVADKLKRLREQMSERDADAHVVTQLDAIAWLFNLRGRDVDFNPVVVAYALVTRNDAMLFLDPAKITPALARQLKHDVTIRPYEDFGTALGKLGKRATTWIDSSTASAWVAERLEHSQLLCAASPIGLMKARKNDTELAGMRAAHIRDGAAMVRFLAWLDDTVATGETTELGAANQLEIFRAEGQHFQGLSFPTISGYGPHGAVIHYRVTEASNIPIRPTGLYLVDSGAQYLDGTTDVTRTVAVGNNTTRQERDAYTRVLKGHIGLARAKFPAGASGARLDTLARQHLWQAGMDYGHGTGHGVGAYLNVHEGPQSISPRASAPLEPGNVQSNEPGYYRDGKFGVRIENLVEVVKAAGGGDADRSFNELATLTLCPIDTRPIEVSLLDDEERRWLNAYHKRVKQMIGPLVDAPTRRWLNRACKPLVGGPGMGTGL
jgi:Xaa-Pro aminopeptidase